MEITLDIFNASDPFSYNRHGDEAREFPNNYDGIYSDN